MEGYRGLDDALRMAEVGLPGVIGHYANARELLAIGDFSLLDKPVADVAAASQIKGPFEFELLRPGLDSAADAVRVNRFPASRFQSATKTGQAFSLFMEDENGKRLEKYSYSDSGAIYVNTTVSNCKVRGLIQETFRPPFTCRGGTEGSPVRNTHRPGKRQ